MTWSGQDDDLNTGTATQNATVLDTTPPQIFCNAPATIVPPNAPISFTAAATDGCDADPAFSITDFYCFKFTKKGKRIDKTGSCEVTLADDTVTISDSGGVADRIQWTVVATDGSGNVTQETCGVVVTNPGRGV